MQAFCDDLIVEVANGDAEALIFLRQYLELGHRIDDVIDCDDVTNEHIVQTFLLMLNFLSLNPFYLRYRELLYPLVCASLNAYGTSVGWEKSPEAHKKLMADQLRAAGVQVLEFVSMVCGGPRGLERMRLLSPRLRENSWRAHHTEKGEAA